MEPAISGSDLAFLVLFLLSIYVVTQLLNAYLLTSASDCDDHRPGTQGEPFEYHGTLPSEWVVNGSLTSQDFRVIVTRCLTCDEPMLRSSARKTENGHFVECAEDMALHSASKEKRREINRALQRAKRQFQKRAKHAT